jgi:hypothetical protein
MRLGRSSAATMSRLNAARLIGAHDHSLQKIHRGFLNRQLVLFTGKQETTKPLVQQKALLTAQSLLELECSPLRERTGGLAQSLAAKRKHRAIVAVHRRVPDTVRFVAVEE